MQFINNGTSKPNGESPKMTIYGLDADLIVLSMALNKRQIKLLREPQNASVELAQYHSTPFLFLDIDKVSDALLSQYSLQMYERVNIINDFVFFSFFGGNDFVDPFLHTKMRDNGLDKLFIAYKQALSLHGYLVIDDSINLPCLISLLQTIALTEDTACKKIQTRQFSNFSPKRSTPKTPAEKFESAISDYQHSFYTNSSNPFYVYYKQHLLNSFDCRKPHSVWKTEYNSQFFNKTPIYDVCADFLKCLKWTLQYYRNGLSPSWLWVYSFSNSPLSSDFLDFLKSFTISSFTKFWNSLSFPSDSPLSPVEQLIAVLPPQNAGLLPFAFGSIIRDPELHLDHMFPWKIKLDVVKGQKNIYSEPVLQPIDVHTIKKMMKSIPFSEPELARNIIKERLFCFKV